MRHCWSVILWYCYRLYGLYAFSNQHAVLRKLKCGSNDGNLEQLWISV